MMPKWYVYPKRQNEPIIGFSYFPITLNLLSPAIMVYIFWAFIQAADTDIDDIKI